MLAVDQTNFDCEYNGGFNAIEPERIHLHTSVKCAMPTKQQQLDQQQQPSNSDHHQLQQLHQQQQHLIEPVSTIDTAHQQHQHQHQDYRANNKKSVMLNLKSGTINSTVEEFGSSLSTRFGDTFTRSGRRCRWWLLIIGIFVGAVCCIVTGAAVTHLFGTRSCDCKLSVFIIFFPSLGALSCYKYYKYTNICTIVSCVKRQWRAAIVCFIHAIQLFKLTLIVCCLILYVWFDWIWVPIFL